MSTYQDNCLTKLNESRHKIKFFGRNQRTDTAQQTRTQSTEIQGNKNPFYINSRFVDKPNSVPNPFATQQRLENKNGNSQSLDRNNGFFSSNMNTLSMPRDNYNPNSNFTQNFVGKSNPFDQNSVVNQSWARQKYDPNMHTYTNSGQVYRKDQFLQEQKRSFENQQHNGPRFSVPNINNNNGFINNHNNKNINREAISPVSPASGSVQPSFITGLSNNSTQNQRCGGFNTNFANVTSSQNIQKNNGNQGLSIPRKSINNFQQPTQQSRLIFQQQGQKRQSFISGQIPNSPQLQQPCPQPPFPQINSNPIAPDIKNNQNSRQTMVQNPQIVNDAPHFNLAEYNKLKQQLEAMVNLTLLPLAQAYSQKKKQRQQENQRMFQQYLLQEEQKAREYRPVWFDDNSDGLFVSKRVRRKQEQERRIIINVVPVKKQTIMRQRCQIEKKLKNFHHNYEKNQQRLQNISRFADDICKFDLHQEQKIKNVKKQRKDEVNNFEHIQVSQFPDSWKLQYSADLRWLEEPNIIRKTFDKAYVYVSERPSRKQIQQSILLDIRSKGLCLRQNFIYKENDFDFKRYKPNFFMKYLFGRKQREFKEFVVSCTIFERKINLPPSYKCNLPIFKGFTVKNLEIRNQYGSITWEGQTKIQNISFAKGIKISKDEVDCQIAELEKQAIVEFYSLPIQTQGKSTIKIQRQLQKLARGAEVISVDMDKKSWKLKVNLGRQQK